MLREWQSQCVSCVLDTFREHKNHFLCQATPGAGKTVMAAEVARRLRESHQIDLVLCFSPSVSVSENMQRTFSERLGCAFDGGLGSIGGSYTYQSLKFLGEAFWHTMSKYRVLAVFDEIHHCAAEKEGSGNVWGEQVVSHIQANVTFSLALTGTPWRSDAVPIAMARYTDPEGRIICDYQYGLKEAIADEVCRRPKIVLVDNEYLTVAQGAERLSFSSIWELLKESNTSYQDIIHNTQALKYLLALGCEKLGELRAQNPIAGGLIVAASVSHAERIQQLLEQEYQQNTILVTYQQASPLESIERFRQGESDWIISVGMVSEGTDIPRLQVCCHVSSVKTELYFRQVLGRILRMNHFINQEAWLYTFAEEQLVSFAERVEQDIPEACQLIHLKGEAQFYGQQHEAENDRGVRGACRGVSLEENGVAWGEMMEGSMSRVAPSSISETLVLGNFKKRVVDAFT